MNTNNRTLEQPKSLKDIDFKYHIQHYLHLFWKWKWYSLIIGPTIGIVAFLLIMQSSLLRHPSLPATVLIGLKSKSGQAYSESSTSDQAAQEHLLLSRPFLEKVVKRLSLQLVVAKYSRDVIFDSVKVDSAVLIGTFKFEIDKENPDFFQFLYSDARLNNKNKVISSGRISDLKVLTLPGMYLSFSEYFLKEPQDFSFSTLSMRYAVDRIINKLSIPAPDPDKVTNYIIATFKDSDYSLAAQTINTIATMFVESNFNSEKLQKKETIIELEKQLAAADQQQTISRNSLRDFLSRNPSIGLDQRTQQTMSDLISLENSSNSTNNLISEFQNLKDKWSGATTQDDKIQIISEIIVLLQAHGSLSAATLQANLYQYTLEKENALQNYAKSHPIFTEIDGKFASLSNRTIQAVDYLISQQKKIMNDRGSSIQKVTSKLQALPSQELQLAELKKRQDIDEELYSKLLTKYNELKVAETVEASDYYILEYAVPPIAPSRLLQFAQGAGIVFLGVLLFAFGPPIGFDLIDKTARTEQALVRMIPYRFLETIPVIKRPKQHQNTKKNGHKSNINPNKIIRKTQYNGEILISEPGINPPSALELFRSLTTKIQLDLFNEPDKSFVVTSYEMDEGKSTVAANIAISFAEHGTKTILIDCDLRRGVAHKILSIKKAPGLSEYLSEMEKNKGTTIPLESIIQRTTIPNLWVIPTGDALDNPQKLLSSPALAELKKHLLEQSFFVIIDSPPVAVAADSAILSNITSRYVLVIRAGRTNVVNLKKILISDYPTIENKILGVVLNMGINTVPTKYYSYYQSMYKKNPQSDT